MNYNEIVSMLRSSARDVLRLRMVNEVRNKALEVQNVLDAATKRHEELQAAGKERLAVLAYNLSRLEDANPIKEKLAKEYTEASERLAKDLTADAERYNEVADSLNKELEELKKQIDKVQSGEIKVCKSDLSHQVDRMIESVVDASIRESVAAAVVNTPTEQAS